MDSKSLELKAGPLAKVGALVSFFGCFYGLTRMASLGFLAGLGYGLLFRRSLQSVQEGAGARFRMPVRVLILMLSLALLSKLGPQALFAFPAGFLLYLVDLIVEARRQS